MPAATRTGAVQPTAWWAREIAPLRQTTASGPSVSRTPTACAARYHPVHRVAHMAIGSADHRSMFPVP